MRWCFLAAVRPRDGSTRLPNRRSWSILPTGGFGPGWPAGPARLCRSRHIPTKEAEMRVSRLMVAVIALVLAGPHAYSQERGDWRKGHGLARGVCAECHAVRARELR